MKRRVRILGCVAGVCCIGGVVALGAVLLWPMDTEPFTGAMRSGELRDRNGDLLQAYLTAEDQWCLPRNDDGMHPWVRQATVAVEDQRFYTHPGVDPIAVARAALQNLRRGEVVSGASTLTMQLVKLKTPARVGLTGKIVQAVRALRLDAHAEKEALLTAYLNNAPYGGNLIGVDAAAHRYFGKPARELRLSEAALLAGIPKSPAAYDPLRHRDRARERRNHVLDRMLEEGFITPELHTHARAAALGVRYHAFPMEAPHLGAQFAGDAAKGTTVSTTIDRRIQRMVQAKVTEQVNTLGPAITNGAALVVDVATASVLAHVGSADFFSAPGGQVDATRAARSPGSTLKPFTYARAMQGHLLYPREVLLDAPRDYGRYNPGNFDGTYYGPVSAADALAASRNIPALTVLERVGYADLKIFLQRAGLTTLTRPADHYGLGLTLGNCEVRLDELVAAYTMLASGGKHRPLRWTAADESPAREVLSPGICQAVFTMLAQPLEQEQWRDDPSIRNGAPRVAWKTGTSTGFHDAWTVMYDGRYVVGVWIGNANGKPDGGLVGAKAALPVATRIFRALPGGAQPVQPSFGDVTRPVKVCAQTGLPRSRWCAATRIDSFPIGIYQHRRCDVHHPAANGVPYERWPAGPAHWDLAAVPEVASPTPRTATRQVSLRITHPVGDADFVLTHEPGGDTIALEAAGGNGPLHWYANGKHLGQTDTSTTLTWKLAAGDHTLACMDASGATDTVRFTVEEPGAVPAFRM
jgi:penicillin-binding protein 1C